MTNQPEATDPPRREPSRVISYPAQTGKIVTRVLECGDGTRSLVLLHGAGSRADRFTPVIPALADAGYRVRALDLPGHGFAEKPGDFDYTTPSMAAQIEAYLDQEGPADLVGTSLGGHIAAWLAVHRPDLVSAAVLVGPTGLVRRDTSTSKAISDNSASGVRAKLKLLLHDPSAITDQWVREESRINNSPGAAAASARLLEYLRSGINEDLVAEQLASSAVPVRLIWGSDDKWIPLEIAHRVAEQLPASPLYVMRSAGHAPYFERPGTFASLVISFLADPQSQTPGIFEV